MVPLFGVVIIFCPPGPPTPSQLKWGYVGSVASIALALQGGNYVVNIVLNTTRGKKIIK
jgi:hypothetical protein